jgi:3-dehydroquinate dehydratase I
LKGILSNSPKTVATVTTNGDLAQLNDIESVVDFDILEFRFDNLFADKSAATDLVKTLKTPILGTVRCPEEGGAHSLTPAMRIELYEEILPLLELVDTEITSLSLPEFANFASEVQGRRIPLIASFHDFEAFPGTAVVAKKMNEAFELGADVAKVAVHLETMKDLFSLVELVESHRSDGRLVSAMGMGPLGKISRLILAKAGSCLNYGYLQQPNAPGQWSARELRGLISEF